MQYWYGYHGAVCYRSLGFPCMWLWSNMSEQRELMGAGPVTIGYEVLDDAHGRYRGLEEQNTSHKGRVADTESWSSISRNHRDRGGVEEPSSSSTWESYFGDVVERAFYYCRRATQVYRNISLLRNILGSYFPESRLLKFEELPEESGGGDYQDTVVAVILPRSITWKRQSDNYELDIPVHLPEGVELVPCSATKDSSGEFIFLSTTQGEILGIRKGGRHASSVLPSDDAPWNTKYYHDQPVLVHVMRKTVSLGEKGLPATMVLITVTASGRLWSHTLVSGGQKKIEKTHYVAPSGFTLVTAADIKHCKVKKHSGYLLVLAGLSYESPTEMVPSEIVRFFWVTSERNESSIHDEPILLSELETSSLDPSEWIGFPQFEETLYQLVEASKDARASVLFRRKKTHNSYVFGLVRFLARPHEFEVMLSSNRHWHRESVIWSVRLQAGSPLTAILTTANDFYLLDFMNAQSPFYRRSANEIRGYRIIFDWLDHQSGILLSCFSRSYSFYVKDGKITFNPIPAEDVQSVLSRPNSVLIDVVSTLVSLAGNLPAYQLIILESSTQWQYLCGSIAGNGNNISIRKPTSSIDARIQQEMTDPFRLGKLIPSTERTILSASFIVEGQSVAVLNNTRTKEFHGSRKLEYQRSVIECLWRLASRSMVGHRSGGIAQGGILGTTREVMLSLQLPNSSTLRNTVPLLDILCSYSKKSYALLLQGCLLELSSSVMCSSSGRRYASEMTDQVGLKEAFASRSHRLLKLLDHACSSPCSTGDSWNFNCSRSETPSGNEEYVHRFYDRSENKFLDCTLAVYHCPRCATYWKGDSNHWRRHKLCLCRLMNGEYFVDYSNDTYHASLIGEIEITSDSSETPVASFREKMTETIFAPVSKEKNCLSRDCQSLVDILSNSFDDKMEISIKTPASYATVFTVSADAGSSLHLVSFIDLVKVKMNNVMSLFARKWSPDSLVAFVKSSIDRGNRMGAESALKSVFCQKDNSCTSRKRFEFLRALLEGIELCEDGQSVWDSRRAMRETFGVYFSSNWSDAGILHQYETILQTLLERVTPSAGNKLTLDILRRTIKLANYFKSIFDALRSLYQDFDLESTLEDLEGVTCRELATCAMWSECQSLRDIFQEVLRMDSHMMRQHGRGLSERLLCHIEKRIEESKGVLAPTELDVPDLVGEVDIRRNFQRLCSMFRSLLVATMSILCNAEDDSTYVPTWCAHLTFIAMQVEVFPREAVVSDITDMIFEYRSLSVLEQYLGLVDTDFESSVVINGVFSGTCCWLRRHCSQTLMSLENELMLAKKLRHISRHLQKITYLLNKLSGGDKLQWKLLSAFSCLCGALSYITEYGLIHNKFDAQMLLSNALSKLGDANVSVEAVTNIFNELELTDWKSLYSLAFNRDPHFRFYSETTESSRDFNEYRLITQRFSSLQSDCSLPSQSQIYAVFDESQSQHSKDNTWTSGFGPLLNPLAMFSSRDDNHAPLSNYSSTEDTATKEVIVRAQCYKSLLLSQQSITSGDFDLGVPCYPNNDLNSFNTEELLSEGILDGFPFKSQLLILVKVCKELLTQDCYSEAITCFRCVRIMVGKTEETVDSLTKEEILGLLENVQTTHHVHSHLHELYCEVAQFIGALMGRYETNEIEVASESMQSLTSLFPDNSSGFEADEGLSFCAHPFWFRDVVPLVSENQYALRVRSQILIRRHFEAVLDTSLKANKHSRSSFLQYFSPILKYDTQLGAATLCLVDDNQRAEFFSSWLNQLRVAIRYHVSEELYYEWYSPSNTNRETEMDGNSISAPFNLWKHLLLTSSSHDLSRSLSMSKGDVIIEELLKEQLVYIATQSHTPLQTNHEVTEGEYSQSDIMQVLEMFSVPVNPFASMVEFGERDMQNRSPWQDLAESIWIEQGLKAPSNRTVNILHHVFELIFNGPSLVIKLQGVFLLSSWSIQHGERSVLEELSGSIIPEEEKLACGLGVVCGAVVSHSSLIKSCFEENKSIHWKSVGTLLQHCSKNHANAMFRLIDLLWKMSSGQNHQRINLLLFLISKINFPPTKQQEDVSVIQCLHDKFETIDPVLQSVSQIDAGIDLKRCLGLPFLLWNDLSFETAHALLDSSYGSFVASLDRLAQMTKVREPANLSKLVGRLLSILAKTVSEKSVFEKSDVSKFAKPGPFMYVEILCTNLLVRIDGPKDETVTKSNMKAIIFRKKLSVPSTVRLLCQIAPGSFTYWIEKFRNRLPEEIALDGTKMAYSHPHWYSHLSLLNDTWRQKVSSDFIEGISTMLVEYLRDHIVCSELDFYEEVMLIDKKIRELSGELLAFKSWHRYYYCMTQRGDSAKELHVPLKQALGLTLAIQAFHGHLQYAFDKMKKILADLKLDNLRKILGDNKERHEKEIEEGSPSNADIEFLLLEGFSVLIDKAFRLVVEKLSKVENPAQWVIDEVSRQVFSGYKFEEEIQALSNLEISGSTSALFVLSSLGGNAEEFVAQQLADCKISKLRITTLFAERIGDIANGDTTLHEELHYLIDEIVSGGDNTKQESEERVVRRIVRQLPCAEKFNECSTFEETSKLILDMLRVPSDPFRGESRLLTEALMSLFLRWFCLCIDNSQVNLSTSSVSRKKLSLLARVSAKDVGHKADDTWLDQRIQLIKARLESHFNQLNGIISDSDIGACLPRLSNDNQLGRQCLDLMFLLMDRVGRTLEIYTESDQERGELLQWMLGVCRGAPRFILSENQYQRILDKAREIQRSDFDFLQCIWEICAPGAPALVLYEISSWQFDRKQHLHTSTILAILHYSASVTFALSPMFTLFSKRLGGVYRALSPEELQKAVLVAVEFLAQGQYELAVSYVSLIVGGSGSDTHDVQLLHRFLHRSLKTFSEHAQIRELICAAMRIVDENLMKHTKEGEDTISQFLAMASGSAGSGDFDTSTPEDNVAESPEHAPGGSSRPYHGTVFPSFHSWFSSF